MRPERTALTRPGDARLANIRLDGARPRFGGSAWELLNQNPGLTHRQTAQTNLGKGYRARFQILDL